MGVGKSTLQSADNDEGSHFRELIQRDRRPSKLPPIGSAGGKASPKVVTLHPNAAVILRVDPEMLWEKFLSSSASTFALTPAEANTLIKGSLKVTLIGILIYMNWNLIYNVH